MLKEEFETWSTDPRTKETLIQLDLHVSTLGYLEEGLIRFLELPDNNTKKNRQIIGLNTTAAIPDNNPLPNSPDLNDLEAEQAKKKEKKAQKQ